MKLGVDRALVGDFWVDGDVRVEDGHVVEVGIGRGAGSGLIAAPGFVDLQINGFAGVDFRQATVEEILAASDALVATGATAFLPTLHNCSVEDYVAALRVIHEAQDHQERRGATGAWIGGAHLEGPFLSKRWAGAHDPSLLVEADLLVLHRLVGAGPINLVTLAPELPGALEMAARLVNIGIAVAMGHTDADAADCHRAISAGVTMLTHCWNAHRRFAPRDPGPAGVALGELYVGLICDRIHTADETLRLSFAAAGERACVVSDATAAAGTGEAEVTPRLSDGTLAGGAATMDRAVRNLMEIGIPLERALFAASTAPSGVIGQPVLLAAGAIADIVILDGDDLTVRRTLLDGRVVHHT